MMTAGTESVDQDLAMSMFDLKVGNRFGRAYEAFFFFSNLWPYTKIVAGQLL